MLAHPNAATASSISALATEAQLPRRRLYEHHADLITEFHTKAGGGPIPPSVAALRQQLADARIQQLEAREAQLLAQNQTLCAVITELTHETTPTTSSRSTSDGTAGHDQGFPNNINYSSRNHGSDTCVGQ